MNSAKLLWKHLNQTYLMIVHKRMLFTGSDDDALKSKKAVLRNDKVLASLTLAFTTNELLDVMMESQTDEWPDGQTWTVMKRLQEKCCPSDTMSMVDERIALNNVKIEKNEDPSKLFERIKAVETKCNTKTRKILRLTRSPL